MQQDWQLFLENHRSSTHAKAGDHSQLLFDLSGYGVLKISGPDAGKLLQGQVTCDVLAMKPNQSSLAALCNPQGRVISLFRLLHFQAAYYLFLPRNMLPQVKAALKKYGVFYKINLSDETEKIICIGMLGSMQDGMMKAESPLTQQFAIDSARHLIIGDLAEIKIIWERLAGQLPIATSNSWRLLDIYAGVPNIYPETSMLFLPHEIGLHKLNAINFEKGCYTGQEIIARMHYRGKLKKNMYRARISSLSALLPGATIHYQQGQETKIAGSVVDSCYERYNNYVSLIMTEETAAKDNHLFTDDPQSFFKLLD